MEPTLFDAIVERDEALDKIAGNTDASWAAAAENSIRWLARSRPWFTTDDVWEHLSHTCTAQVHDNRAIGPVMRRMASDGVIAPTEHFVPSKRRHASPIRCWKANR